mmetsp:Transcript_47250/g.117954  ORF Transcript_47250/g.117954 Transcript_47250/m.117954 type:complete len:219 (-) Transcript_47250:937-1593(-)
MKLPGRLNLAVLSRERKSCSGARASRPRLAKAIRISSHDGSLTLAGDPNPVYSATCCLSLSLARCHHPSAVSLSCVPGYTTLLSATLCGRCMLLLSPPQANCSTFMPGNPKWSRSASTSGVMRPRSSAHTGSSKGSHARPGSFQPSCVAMVSKRAHPGALTHSPSIAFWCFLACCASTRQKASKPRKWSMRMRSTSSMVVRNRSTHHLNPLRSASAQL